MLNDLAGKYIGSYRDAVRARSIELEIVPWEDGQTRFLLAITDAGQFGSVGTIYRGRCVIDHEQVTLHATTRTEWRDTIIGEDETCEYPSNEAFAVTINCDDGRLEIFVPIYEQETLLIKEKPKQL